jgi:ribosomal protein L11
MSGRIPSRSEIPLSATWNLASIFPTDDAFEQALTAADMDAAVRTIAGSARSIGLNVEGV